MFSYCFRSTSLMALSTISSRNILKSSSKLLTHCFIPIKVMPKCNRFYCFKYVDKFATNFLATLDFDGYRAVYPELVKVLTDDYMKLNPELEPALTRFKEVLDYNVFPGKALRGLLAVLAVQNFAWPNKLSPENLHLSYVLGWLVDTLQKSYLILDDLMDNSEIRRTQKCWYKKVGLFAINDAHSLEAGIMMLLRKYFRQKPYYYDLVELFHQIIFESAFGEQVDKITATETISMETFRKLSKNKVAGNSFYLPFAGGLMMNGIKDPSIYEWVDKIAQTFAFYVQVQDDYLDIFADPAVTGKIGSDIQNGTNSWFIIEAKRLGIPEQVAILNQNYGKNDPACVAKVKDVFNDLQLETKFRKYEDEEMENLTKLIKDFNFPYPTDVFSWLAAVTYRRKT